MQLNQGEACTWIHDEPEQWYPIIIVAMPLRPAILNLYLYHDSLVCYQHTIRSRPLPLP